VPAALARYDFMILPTHNENFGYAILDALAAGCPVLLSDQTPWRDLEAAGAGWTIPLADPERFARTIEACVAMGPDEHARRSAAAHAYALRAATDPGAVGRLEALLTGA
jgi:glycosyltransferase involved in cell wall biosynthesis